MISVNVSDCDRRPPQNIPQARCRLCSELVDKDETAAARHLYYSCRRATEEVKEAARGWLAEAQALVITTGGAITSRTGQSELRREREKPAPPREAQPARETGPQAPRKPRMKAGSASR